MIVQYGEKFKQHLRHFPTQDQLKIKAFVDHVKQFGLVGLQGRNKSSDDVPRSHPNWLNRVRYAQEYHLWHYHIGIVCYTTSEYGDLVSEYVLHYMRGDDVIRIVDLSAHPPLCLPSLEYLI